MAVNDQKASELSLATSLNDNDKFLITMKSPSIRLDNLEKIIYINGEEGIIR